MTEHDLLKHVSTVTGVAMNRIVKQPGERPTKRVECDARALTVLAGRSLWPTVRPSHLGEFLGLSQSGSILALERGNRLFKEDKSFRRLAKLLFAELVLYLHTKRNLDTPPRR